MFSWTGLLILAVLGYVAVVLVRGLIQGGSWLIDTLITEPRERRQAGRQPHHNSHDAADRHKDGGILSDYKERLALSMLRAVYRLSGVSGIFGAMFSRRDFAYWIGLALGESDREKRVKYCAKALRLNPGYEPAWGLRAVALFELKRYGEAIVCFEKVLEMRPNAPAWHKKGLCCYHLKQYSEAAACFEKVQAACADTDRALSDEAARFGKLARDALRPVEPRDAEAIRTVGAREEVDRLSASPSDGTAVESQPAQHSRSGP